VRVLLDTHMLIWALEDSPRLPAWARAVLEDPENDCWVSSASVWEIAIKAMLGKVRLGQPLAALEVAIERAGFQTIDVTLRHAAAIERVEVSHGDPFDRLLLAQCEVETLRLLTADKLLAKLPVSVRDGP
jgi:PIN domain nuclease of toxin-antitoxin system